MLRTVDVVGFRITVVAAVALSAHHIKFHQLQKNRLVCDYRKLHSLIMNSAIKKTFNKSRFGKFLYDI